MNGDPRPEAAGRPSRSAKLWFFVFGLAGLGVGVWLFGRRRKQPR